MTVQFDSTRPRSSSKASGATPSSSQVSSALDPASVESGAVVSADLFDTQAAQPVAAPSVPEARPKKRYTMGRDAYLSVNAEGQIVAGHGGMGRVSQSRWSFPSSESLDRIGADGRPFDVTFTFPNGHIISNKADDSGRRSLALAELEEGLGGKVDPKQARFLQVGVSSTEGSSDNMRVMVLPQDYAGAILIVDVDQTLRDTSTGDIIKGVKQEPVPGSQDLLQGAEKLGVPVIYLSAAPDRLRWHNESFLEHFPEGIYLDDASLGLADIYPNTDVRIKAQTTFKTALIKDLQETYPCAQFFGLGDDKYGDAIVYTAREMESAIRDVVPGDKNIPPNFTGEIFTNYTPEFVEAFLGKLSVIQAETH